jgi:MATE family multidrug resistance protein
LSWDLSKKILAIGVPSGLQWVFEIGAFSFAVLMIGWIGAKQQAAHLIAISMAAVTYMIASGLSAAVAVRVGNHLGLKDKDGMRMAGFSAFIMVLCFMFTSAIMFITCRNILPGFFSNDKEVIGIASSLLIIAALFQLWDGIQVVALGALRGLKDTTWPTIITLIAYWVFGLPVSYLLAFKLNFGAQGVWWGLSFGLFVAALLLFLRFNYVSRKVIK